MTTQQHSDSSNPQRVALVTGGSGGIGQAVAEKLARDGMAVAVHYASNKDKAEQVAQAIIAAGGQAMTVGGDVADETIMKQAFDAVEERFGGLDVLVNTAGLMILAPLIDLDLADLDKMYRTNVRGTFVVNQLAAKRVRSGGAIINFSTSVTRLALPTYSAYCASKGAVEAMTLILDKELAGRDITVNTVAPGPTNTALFTGGKDQATIDRMASMNPMKRIGEPSDIAEVTAFLAGPGRWINGQTIFANGGVI
ncbi:SDR family oxidoreductase [Deinococcus sp.]|uniref:SDR family oxidoreductase n=1 Tax=Deinococcus sp. TaxID=47478 RepID=UPI003B5B9054